MTDVIIQVEPLLELYNNDRTDAEVILNGSGLVIVINLLLMDACTINDVI
jgi:hypothetical protein